MSNSININGIDYIPADQAAPRITGNRAVVVVDRGWIFAGDVTRENEALKAELAEQARLNGMGSEREARLLALNAELVEALRQIEPILARMYGAQAADLPPMQIVRAALAKWEAASK
jgi:hypothetical protein